MNYSQTLKKINQRFEDSPFEMHFHLTCGMTNKYKKGGGLNMRVGDAGNLNKCCQDIVFKHLDFDDVYATKTTTEIVRASEDFMHIEMSVL